jgi:proteasome accessory factor C
VEALTFVPRSPETAHGQVPSPTQGGDVRVRFSPTAAPYLRERFGAEVREVEGGSVEVLVSGDSERWLTRWVLSFGGEAQVLSPSWARIAVARVAKESLS